MAFTHTTRVPVREYLFYNFYIIIIIPLGLKKTTVTQHTCKYQARQNAKQLRTYNHKLPPGRWDGQKGPHSSDLCDSFKHYEKPSRPSTMCDINKEWGRLMHHNTGVLTRWLKGALTPSWHWYSMRGKVEKRSTKHRSLRRETNKPRLTPLRKQSKEKDNIPRLDVV